MAHAVCAVLVRETVSAGRGPSDITAAAVNAAAAVRTRRTVTLSEATVRAALERDALAARVAAVERALGELVSASAALAAQ